MPKSKTDTTRGLNATRRRAPLRNLLLGGGALIALALLFSSIMRPPVPTALLGTPAPDIPRPLLGGGTFAIADHAGDVVVLDFWATWCAPCRVSMPILDRVAQEYEPRGVQLFFVNEGEPADIVEEFASQADLSAPIVLDMDYALGKAFDALGLPFTVIIGRDGLIESVRVGVGPDFEEEFRRDLDAALSK